MQSYLAIFLSIALASGFLQHAYSLSYPSLDMSVPSFSDIQGNTIREAIAGQQIVIHESVRNDVYLNEDKSLTVILDIRDMDGTTIYLSWQSAKVSPDDRYSFGTSWIIPYDATAGTVYEVRAFTITFFGPEAEALSAGFASEITIV